MIVIVIIIIIIISTPVILLIILVVILVIILLLIPNLNAEQQLKSYITHHNIFCDLFNDIVSIYNL
jgi:hypothetical protein